MDAPVDNVTSEPMASSIDVPQEQDQLAIERLQDASLVIPLHKPDIAHSMPTFQPSVHRFLSLAPTTSAVYDKLATSPISPTAPLQSSTQSIVSSVGPMPGLVMPGSQPTMDGAAVQELDVDMLVSRTVRSDSWGSDASGRNDPNERRFLRLGPIHGSNDHEGVGMGSWSESVN